MLRLITDESRMPSVFEFCDGDAIGTKAASFLRAYKTDMDFAMFWEQINGEKITAFVSKIDGEMTVCVSENTDFDELSKFVRVIGFNALFSQKETFKKLGFDCVYGDILKFEGDFESDDSVKFNIEPLPLYKLAYCENSDEINKENYLPWLSDFTFRQRRDMLTSVGIYDKKTLVSCALTSAETESSAIISGVTTDKRYRCQGLAKSCVMTLTNKLKALNRRNIFVLTETQLRTKYYENLGFKKTGRWGRTTL